VEKHGTGVLINP